MAETEKKAVRVSAAIIRREGRVLVCQRRHDQAHPHKWEFPGGKIEPGETPEQCLVREIEEELGARAKIGDLILRHRHDYPGGLEVELWFFEVPEVEGPIRNKIFAQLLWVEPAQLERIDLLEADRPIVDLLGRAD